MQSFEEQFQPRVLQLTQTFEVRHLFNLILAFLSITHKSRHSRPSTFDELKKITPIEPEVPYRHLKELSEILAQVKDLDESIFKVILEMLRKGNIRDFQDFQQKRTDNLRIIKIQIYNLYCNLKEVAF